MTCGPYRDIFLKTYKLRILEIQTHAFVSETDHSHIELKVDANLHGTLDDNYTVRTTLSDMSNSQIQNDESVLRSTEIKHLVQWKLDSSQVKLWWPVGYGEQHLYKATVTLLNSVCLF